ncbi:hypothetical protein GCM10023194_08950 [Planotetraspora phitsanulokensis]|uniref:Uncharacterized protein n=1 Tax=Planotetraspora phitsanulokensis TaxID=575192 RepID=A0A8J3TZ97_9ACTN|nr:hypothetical protein Pph01_03520 [Planotetraspora phitsanulokensis]
MSPPVRNYTDPGARLLCLYQCAMGGTVTIVQDPVKPGTTGPSGPFRPSPKSQAPHRPPAGVRTILTASALCHETMTHLGFS